MTLVRVWRRQLFAASAAALIVPSALVAALIALALGGGFSQLGVLGQIFAGPPAPHGPFAGTGAAGARGAARGAAIPLVPAVQFASSRPGSSRVGGPVRAAAPGTRTGARSIGGAIGPGGAATRPLGGRASHPGAGTPRPPAGGSAGPQPGSSTGPPAGSGTPPPPAPGPSPRPTPVDQVVQIVTSVTSQIPGPAGSTATQAAQSVGTTADNPLPGGGGSSTPGPPPGSPLPAALTRP